MWYQWYSEKRETTAHSFQAAPKLTRTLKSTIDGLYWVVFPPDQWPYKLRVICTRKHFLFQPHKSYCNKKKQTLLSAIVKANKTEQTTVRFVWLVKVSYLGWALLLQISWYQRQNNRQKKWKSDCWTNKCSGRSMEE